MHRLHFWYPPVAHPLQSVLSILHLFRLSHPPPVVCISRPMLFYAGGFPPGGIPGSFFNPKFVALRIMPVMVFVSICSGLRNNCNCLTNAFSGFCCLSIKNLIVMNQMLQLFCNGTSINYPYQVSILLYASSFLCLNISYPF